MKRISIKLTPGQRKQIRSIVGHDADAIELSLEELEERIAPSLIFRDPIDVSLVDGAPGGLDVDAGSLTVDESVSLEGVGDKLDGEYYVESADHTLDDEASKTSFETDRSE